ncbi:MAG: YraN family protein [Burkholderiales bacterium]
MDRRLLGSHAEGIARRHLEAHGLQLVCENYRCRFGEIDLVMHDGRATVFVEVRMRASSTFGGAIESITAAKRSRLLAAARHYLSAHASLPECRFDAVLLNGDGRIDWFKNAFGE